MKEGAVLPRAKQRKFSREEALEVKKQLKDLLEKGKIRISRSASAVPTLFVRKADGTKRWCMDLRQVNKETITDSNKSTLQESARERLRGAKYFTRIDMRDGYHHLRIKEGSEEKTAFLTEYGTYEWLVMCFGLKNAPAEFARFMSDVLREYLNDFVVVYFDDIIIFSNELDTHWRQVRQVLQTLRERKIELKIKKCEFAVTETSFLGQIVNGEYTRMQEEKIRAITEWPTPKDCKGIEEFRGLAGYYRQYIDHFSDRAEPLNEILRTNAFRWTTKEEQSFEELKNQYRGDAILLLFNEEEQIWIHTDASNYALGAEISQLDSQGKRRPVLFYSRKLLPAERNYTTGDKEMLAIVQTFKKHRHMLQGTKYPVIVRTDHRNLRTFMTTKELTARQARWAEELSEYDFVIEHVKGRENKVADALSRREDYRETEDIKENKESMLKEENGKIVINRDARIKMISIEGNREIHELIKKETREETVRKEMKIEEDGFKKFNNKIWVPEKARAEVIKELHERSVEGHQGVDRTVEKIDRQYYFPGMFRKVRKYIKSCEVCNRCKNDYAKPLGKMIIDEDSPTQPWKKVSIDFLEMPKARHPFLPGIWEELIVVVDHFSKQTVLIPTGKEAQVDEVFHLLWEKIFAIFGIPKTIISDRDRIFRSNKWQKLMTDLGTEHRMSTSRHQRTNGQAERKIEELEVFYRIYMDYEQGNWIEITPLAQYMVNDAVSATTGETPNYITFGTVRTNGQDLYEDKTPHGQRMKMIHQAVKAEIDWRKSEQKRFYDATRKEPPNIQVGDRVYLKKKNEYGQGFKTERKMDKFENVKTGPFRIEKKLENDNYQLRLPERMKIHPIFHVSLLSKTDNPETLEDDSTDSEYEVERILAKRTRNGRAEYLVRWAGYGKEDDTWEKSTNLHCPAKIKEFASIGPETTDH